MNMQIDGCYECRVCKDRFSRLQAVSAHLSKKHKIGRDKNKKYILSLPVKLNAVDIETVQRCADREQPKMQPLVDMEFTLWDLEVLQEALPSLIRGLVVLNKLKHTFKR